MMNENLSIGTLLDKLAALILICENHTIIFANPADEKLVGNSETQLPGCRVNNLVYASSSKAFNNWYIQRLAARGNESVDVRLMVANKSLIWVKLTAEAVVFEGRSAQLL